MNCIVESDIIISIDNKTVNKKQLLGQFHTVDMAYEFIEKYLTDNKKMHMYFSRQYLCPREEYEERISENRMIAINVILGQSQDMIYVRKTEL